MFTLEKSKRIHFVIMIEAADDYIWVSISD